MQKRFLWKIQKSAFLFPVVLLLVTLVLGFFLTRFLERVGMKYLYDSGKITMNAIALGVQNELKAVERSVEVMAGSPWIRLAVLDPSSKNIEDANSALDRYGRGMGFSVCYLLDLQGNVIASSNRNAPDSFVGKNYAFRPYFQSALLGEPSVYAAVGATSKARGFYAAYPVKDERGEILGVAVVKKNVDVAKDILWNYPDSFLINPDGIVFLSGASNMVLKTLWPLSDDRVRAINETKQFGQVLAEPVFEKPLQNDEKVMYHGESYRSFRKLLGPPGWSLVILTSLHSVFYFVVFGWIITAFTVGIILILTVWVFWRRRAEEALRESKEYLENLITHTTAPIIVWDPQFRISRFNKAAEALTGREASWAIGKTLDILFPPDRVDVSMELIRKTKSGEQWNEVEIGIQHSNRTVRSVLWNSAPIFGPDRRTLVATIAQGRDITRQKQDEQLLAESRRKLDQEAAKVVVALEESRRSRENLSNLLDENNRMREKSERTAQRLELILASTGEGIFGTDLNGKNTFINHKALEILGYQEGELIDKIGHEVWHHSRSDGTPYPMEECPMHRVLREGQPRSGEEYFWRKDGKGFPVEYSAFPLIAGGKNRGIVVSFRDITERKIFAAAESARVAAELSNKAKSQFLAAMSHEIRTPLSAVIGFAEIVSQTALDDEQKKHIDSISTSGKLLLSLVNDILDFSKIEAGKIALEEVEFDLEHLVKDVFRIIFLKAKETSVRIYVDFGKDLPVRVKGDPTRIRQILINLIGNAIKFTGRGEIGLIVRLSEETVSSEEPVFLITVKDTGIGIPLEKRDLIFHLFSQADMSTTRRFGGTGLGLSISKSLIEIMGGRIWVESQEKAGSEFKFTVKLKKGVALAENGSASLTREMFKGKKVLIVEDNKTLQEILERYCHDMGLSVMAVTSSSEEALDHIRGLSGAFPEVVLSAIPMTGMGGYPFVEKLSTLYPESGMKFVAITSHVWLAAARNSNQKGFHGFVTEPVFRDDLAEVIGVILGAPRAEKKTVARHRADELSCQGTRVLVVEDAPTNQLLIKAILVQWGCVVDLAGDGKEALEKLLANKYDLCFMDLQMPVMGGLEAVQAIRREISKDFPVIVLTAAALDEDRIKCLNAGVTDYLVKPINVDALWEKVIAYGRPFKG